MMKALSLRRGIVLGMMLSVSTVLTSAPSAASAAEPTCTTCPAASTTALMQVAQRVGQTRAQLNEDDIKRMCCPPVMEESYQPYFGYHQLPGENMTMSFGLNYNPPATFTTQMGLWSAYAANAYAASGWTPLGVAMRGDMRTDVPQNGAVVTTWPATAADWATAGSAGDVHTGWNWLSFWDTSGGSGWHFGSTFHDGSGFTAVPNPNHMEPNGRRYMTAISYYILERRNTNIHEYRFRKIDCGDGLAIWRINATGMKLAPGAKPALDSAMVRGRVQTPNTLPADRALVDALKVGRIAR